MTRRLLPIAGVLTVLAAGSATAADVSALRTMAVAPSSYNWTGCYLGIQGGGIAYRNNLAGTWADGGLFGGQDGCNYQIDHFVVGLELEDAWSGSDATLTAATVGGIGPTVTTFKNEWDAAVAARFGLAYVHLSEDRRDMGR
jgi:outer membrane immunogenic protein